MIAAIRAAIGERKHHAARVYFAPRVIFHSITQHLFNHTADDIFADELFAHTGTLAPQISAHQQEHQEQDSQWNLFQAEHQDHRRAGAVDQNVGNRFFGAG